MHVVIFRSRLSPQAGTEYEEMAGRMVELAQAQPGYLSFKSFVAEDGERLALAEFDSAEAVAAWGAHAEHRHAQQRGRETFYDAYSIQVCPVERARDFRRGEEA